MVIINGYIIIMIYDDLNGILWEFMVTYPLVMTNIAIENGHRNSGFSQL